jgi:hypothetical protein
MEAPLILVTCVVWRLQYFHFNHERNIVVFLVFSLHITTLPMPQESVVAESKRTPAIGIAAESEGMVVAAIQQKTSLCHIVFESYLHKGDEMNASWRGHVCPQSSQPHASSPIRTLFKFIAGLLH